MRYTLLIFKDESRERPIRYDIGTDANLAGALNHFGKPVGTAFGTHCNVWCTTELFSFKVYPIFHGCGVEYLNECYEAATEGRLPDVAKMPKPRNYAGE